MSRTRLKNKYNKNRIVQNWEAFRTQCNSCVNLFRTQKRNFYKNLDISQITDNKKFWNTVKPFISNKNKANAKITLIEDERITSKDEEVAETLHKYFVNVTDSLGITENSEIITSTDGVTDPIDQALSKYSNHPSIRKIRSLVQNDGLFHFNNVSIEEMETEIGRLIHSKATTLKNTPPKLLKGSSYICAESLQKKFLMTI